jgi:predicted PurR-regulated permease PerM
MAEKPLPKFFLVLMVVATVLVAYIVRPVIKELLLAIVLAAMLWPVQQWLTRKFGDRRSLAAGILVFAVVILLLGPVATMMTFVIRDGGDAVTFVSDAVRSDDVNNLLEYLPEGAQDSARSAIEQIPRDMGSVMSMFKGSEGEALSTATKVASRAGSFVFHLVLMLIALFFLLVSGRDLVRWLDSVSPLESGQTQELLETFRKVSVAVILSTVVTAAVQAIAALAGYLITQVPSPLFFTLVTFFVAFIPAIGAAVVCLFCAALLLVTGHPIMAIVLAAWGMIVVGLVDNLVKPLLIRRGLEIHGGVVFFSLIGGLAAFGGIGLLVGPLAVAFFLAVLNMYHRDYSPQMTRVPDMPGLDETKPSS